MLLQLPNEVLSHILWRLDDGDVASAMLVNRRISELTVPVFRDLHFGILQVSFDKTGMEKLERMILQDAYRQAVRELRLNPRRFFGEGLAWPRTSNGTLLPSIIVERAQNMLEASFPRCSSISVLPESNSHPDYEEDIRLLPFRDAVAFLFNAVDQGAFPLVSSFTFDLYPGNPKFGLRKVVLPADEATGFWACWARLETICMNMAADEQGRDAASVSQLIRKAQCLQKLSLENCLYGTLDAGALSIYNRLIATTDLPKITHLHIGKVSFASPETLVRLLACFESSLKSIFIEWTVLEQGSWQDVCEALKAGFPKLQTIALSWCGVHHSKETDRTKILQLVCPLQATVPPSLSRNFSFVETKHIMKRMFYCLSGVRYTGKENMPLALELIRDAFYPTTSPPADVPQLERVHGQRRVSKFGDPEFDFVNTGQGF